MEKTSGHFLRLAARILGTTALISLVVLLVGYFLHWTEPLQYSNAFFVAGAIPIVLGVYSIFGGSVNGDSAMMRLNSYVSYSQSAGQAGLDERSQRMVADITQRYGTMIFLLATGLLLILISVGIGQFLVSG